MKTHGFQGSHSKWANYTLKSQFSGLRCAFLNPQSLPIAAPDCPDWFNSSILLNDIGQHHHNSSWALKKWGDPKKSSDKKKCHHSFFTQKISHTHTHTFWPPWRSTHLVALTIARRLWKSCQLCHWPGPWELCPLCDHQTNLLHKEVPVWICDFTISLMVKFTFHITKS